MTAPITKASPTAEAKEKTALTARVGGHPTDRSDQLRRGEDPEALHKGNPGDDRAAGDTEPTG